MLDYGAGTGAILATLVTARKLVAVEFNPHAREYMRRHQPHISTFPYPELVQPSSVDMVYSTSVIEHVECPIQELRALRKALRPGGRIRIGVKNEGVELWRSWVPSNVDNHLYTWNSMLLGNVLRAAGFVVDRIISGGPGHAASLATKRKRVESFILNKSFGTRGHTFQYLWAFGHVPGRGEPFPQRTGVAVMRR